MAVIGALAVVGIFGVVFTAALFAAKGDQQAAETVTHPTMLAAAATAPEITAIPTTTAAPETTSAPQTTAASNQASDVLSASQRAERYDDDLFRKLTWFADELEALYASAPSGTEIANGCTTILGEYITRDGLGSQSTVFDIEQAIVEQTDDEFRLLTIQTDEAQVLFLDSCSKGNLDGAYFHFQSYSESSVHLLRLEGFFGKHFQAGCGSS